MAQSFMNVRIVTRNDTAQSWLEKNPVLLLGEFGYENDTGLLKIGDGSSSWQDLKYTNLSQGDDTTITLGDNGTLSLKNWGVQYYKWVESEVEGETGSHVLQVVDEENPWIAGLEPKAIITADGSTEIAWYQPSTITIQGVNSAITTVQNVVSNLAESIGSSYDAVGTETVYGEINTLKEIIPNLLPVTGGVLTGDLVLKDSSVAASEKVVDTKIATAIGSAGHLKREIVDSLPEIDSADANTIYMVENDKNTYDEYILVEGSFEVIGNTQVDLTSYLKKVENATEGNFAMLNSNGEIVDSSLNASGFVPVSHLEGFIAHVTNEERELWNAKIDPTDEVYQKTTENIDKIVNLPSFSGIGTGLEIAEGLLKTVDIPIAGENLGVVKSSNKDGQIKIEADGTMTMNKISVNNLYVPEDSELVLNGGSAV